MILPVAVKRNFAPPRTSMFVSTHSFVAGMSISYDLLLPVFAWAVCARAAGPGHTMLATHKTSTANFIVVLVFVIAMACPCLG